MTNELMGHADGAEAQALEEVERLLGRELLDAHRALLLRSDGGRPVRPYFAGSSVDGEDVLADVHTVFPTRREPERLTLLDAVAIARRAGLPRDLVPFAHDGGANLWCVSATDGRVALALTDEEPPEIRWLTMMLDAFLEALVSEPPEW